MLGSAQSGYGKVLLVEGYVQGPQCSPKHNTFDLSGYLCLGDPPLPFLPRESKDKPWKHRLRERTNRRLHRQPSKKHSKPMFRATFVTCSRTHQGMDTDGLERVTDGLENWVSPKKSHQRSQSTGCVLVRKAPTKSQASVPQVKGRWGLQRLPRQGVNVKSTWPGCEVKQVGDLSLFAIPLPLVSHTRPMDGHRRRQMYPLWW